MSSYVEKGYSKGYVEGDDPSSAGSNVASVDSVGSSVVSVDSVAILAELSALKQQNKDLNTKLDAILSAISTNKTIELSNSSKLVALDTKINATIAPDLSNLVTKSYIDAKVPFVDDMNVKVFRKGTKVTVTDYSGYGVVVSSSLLPSDVFDYTVVYSVRFSVDGVVNVSNFLSQQVAPYVAS